MYAVVLFLQHYFSNFYSSACLGPERSIGASLLKGPLAHGAGKPSTEMSVLGGLAVLGLLTHPGCSGTWAPRATLSKINHVHQWWGILNGETVSALRQPVF